MTDTWWVIIRTPRGRFLVDFGQDPPTKDAEMVALRAEYGVPDDWCERHTNLGEDWYVGISQGQPHPELFWSAEQLSEGRDRAEAAAGIPAQRAHVQSMREALKSAEGSVPEEVLDDMWGALHKFEQSIPKVGLEDVRAVLADIPPSESTVVRKDPKDPVDPKALSA